MTKPIIVSAEPGFFFGWTDEKDCRSGPEDDLIPVIAWCIVPSEDSMSAVPIGPGLEEDLSINIRQLFIKYPNGRYLYRDNHFSNFGEIRKKLREKSREKMKRELAKFLPKDSDSAFSD